MIYTDLNEIHGNKVPDQLVGKNAEDFVACLDTLRGVLEEKRSEEQFQVELPQYAALVMRHMFPEFHKAGLIVTARTTASGWKLDVIQAYSAPVAA